MIQVLQFADFINRFDFIDNIVNFADRSRFNVSVCVRTDQSNIAAPNYPLHTLGATIHSMSRRHAPGAAWRLARLLREWKINILHTHHYDQAVIGWLATRLYPRTRLVVGRHYSDALYRLQPGAKRSALLKLENAVNRDAARIVVPSNYILEILTERQGIDPDKIDLIPYGFVPEKYQRVDEAEVERIRRDFGLEGKFVIGSFGRLHEEKGHRHLLDALVELIARRHQLRLLIVGEGPERIEIERRIEALNLRGVVLLAGWRRDAMSLMAAVDVVVQPTLQEAFSQVMAESLWMAKPLVITDVSGAPDVISDGENGLLVRRGDAAALACAIERLMDDGALRQRVALAGKRYVEENLAIGKIIPKYEQSYLRAL